MAIQQDDKNGQLSLTIEGKEAFVYNFGSDLDLTYFHPLNTPSGKNLLEHKASPYPHHRAFWFADYVSRDGVKANVYNSYYSGKKVSKEVHVPPFDLGIRHVDFPKTETTGSMAVIEERLTWETSRTTQAFPLIDEHRLIKVKKLDRGYFMDLTFTLKASHGDVTFLSDAVHYAWPYLRINANFNGTTSGTITSDTGATGQVNTNMKPALWVDYSNHVDGTSEGVTLMQFPDGNDHLWLTREYGTFGPRRHEEKSGKPFVLKQDATITQRAGIYVHTGDVKSADVTEIYRRYSEGAL